MSVIIAWVLANKALFAAIFVAVLSEVAPFLPTNCNGIAQALVQALKKKPGLPLPALVFGVVLLSSCSSALDKARIATTAAADLGLSSAKFVADWNDACEGSAKKLAEANQVVESRAKRDECRATYDKLDKAVKTYGAAVAGTRAGVELAHTMKKLDLGVVLRELLSAGKALKGALAAFGIDVPTGGLL
jgi:transposase